MKHSNVISSYYNSFLFIFDPKEHYWRRNYDHNYSYAFRQIVTSRSSQKGEENLSGSRSIPVLTMAVHHFLA